MEMKRYRKKPVIVEATRIYYLQEEFPEVLVAKYVPPSGPVQYWSANEEVRRGGVPGHDFELVVRTLEGDMTVSDGDWLIKGVKGEYYPCKHEIFLQTYEEVDE